MYNVNALEVAFILEQTELRMLCTSTCYVVSTFSAGKCEGHSPNPEFVIFS